MRVTAHHDLAVVVRAALLAAAALCCVACPVIDAAAPPDAGPDEADFGDDAGRTSAETCEAGPCAPVVDGEACTALVAASCGGADGGARCDDAPGCEAATLLSRYEAHRCADALTDDARFPQCEDTACAVLVARVCGPAGACAESPGCDPAQRLFTRSVSADAGDALRRDALASCAAALEDEDVFAACSE